MFKNWEYVVLSRVHTLSGLYLVESIDMENLFKPSSELKKYIENARQKETNILEKKMCNSTTKLAVKVCGNGQWQQDINAMEVDDGGECNPTYTRNCDELPESSQRAPKELLVPKQTIPVWN
jgi:hypothetical protein